MFGFQTFAPEGDRIRDLTSGIEIAPTLQGYHSRIIADLSLTLKTRHYVMAQREQSSVIDVFCVYGPTYPDFIHAHLIPAIARQTRIYPRLHLINFTGPDALFPRVSKNGKLRIQDWSNQRTPVRIGFGEGINLLYNFVKPVRSFIVINPDCIPDPKCIFTLLNILETEDAAMVEARQWPNEHPKTYDPETLQTFWCSGALFAMSSLFFKQVEGFDELLFLYAEDVDLSWRVRSAGGKILMLLPR